MDLDRASVAAMFDLAAKLTALGQAATRLNVAFGSAEARAVSETALAYAAAFDAIPPPALPAVLAALKIAHGETKH